MVLVPLFITGTIAFGGVSQHEVPDSVLRASAGIYPDIRGSQQASTNSDSGGNRRVSLIYEERIRAVYVYDLHVAHERHNRVMASRWDMGRWTPGKVSVLQAAGINWNIQYPTLNASLQQQAELATATSNSTPAGNIPKNISTGGASGAKGLFNALRSAGASQASAIGLIANAMNESSLNPEARALDTNGRYSNGLWQFNEESYPDSGSLVTGDPSKDMIAQIRYLFNHGGLSAAAGSTPQQAAGNFASQFEQCAGCQPGGAQYNSRVSNVATVLSELGLL